jgi:23S rRNA (adenine2030-N6)-methyltransferase
VLAIELMLRPPRDPNLLNGCGLIVANPPFVLETEMQTLLPELALIFADPGVSTDSLHRVDWVQPSVAKQP